MAYVDISCDDLLGRDRAARVVPVVDPVRHAEDGPRGERRVHARSQQAVLGGPVHEVAEVLVVVVLGLDDLGRTVGAQRPEVAEEDDRVGGVLERAPHVPSMNDRSAATGSSASLPPLRVLGDDPLVVALDDREEQILLGVDVVVHAALEDPDLVGDLLQARRVVPLAAEDRRGRVDDQLGPVEPALSALARVGLRRVLVIRPLLHRAPRILEPTGRLSQTARPPRDPRPGRREPPAPDPNLPTIRLNKVPKSLVGADPV